MDDDLRVLTRVPNEVDAFAIVGTLQDAGIEAVATGGFTAGFIAEAPGDVQVLVKSIDLPQARVVLKKYADSPDAIDWSQVDVGDPEPSAPDHPVGPFEPTERFDATLTPSLIESIEAAPRAVRQAVRGLTEPQLNTVYKNWSIRQIVHHLADSHVHSYIRFKWALTESNPTIKAYDEADWVVLDDSKHGGIAPALALLDGLHAKWEQLLQGMSRDTFSRTFVHPQTHETVSLWTALNYYAWHARHHTGQILWLRHAKGW